MGPDAMSSTPVPVTSPARATTRPKSRKISTGVILTVLVIQSICAFFFVADILSSVVGFSATPINWRIREYIEIGAAIGLVIGLVLGALVLRNILRQSRAMERQLRAASSAFMDLLQERFTAWGLTPAERDVALFAIKGLSTQDIAQLRSTSEGTVKAQTTAIYRKAGVTGRPQLLSLFIDDMMDDNLPMRAEIRRK
jgi:DNA-binding CsgD family transcriptional regulator